MMLYSLVSGYRSFTGTYHLHLQDRSESKWEDGSVIYNGRAENGNEEIGRWVKEGGSQWEW
jgi:hypothetical protein